MKSKILSAASCFIFLLLLDTIWAQRQPSQPSKGYGANEYSHGDVIQLSRGNGEESFMLYMPDKPKPTSAGVVLFNHGYGAVNPAIYGAWIAHLVRKGNIVIYPRYQERMLSSPATFTPNSAAAARAAFELIRKSYPDIKTDGYVIIGHSYGGIVSANEASAYELLLLPRPKAIMLCTPGTRGHDTGRYDSYKSISSPILIISEKDDEVVGGAFSKEIFESISTPANMKAWYVHRPDSYGTEKITATHGECISSDKIFDSGEGGKMIRQRIESSRPNAVDYFCYWRLADALIDAAFNTNDFARVFGGGNDQLYMGKWSDGRPIIPLKAR